MDLPRAIIAVPTFRCPLSCRHCDLWQVTREEIPSALWRERILELGSQVGRPFLVGISGGEPMVYPGIFTLVEACAEAGLRTALSTSALPLVERAIHQILYAGLTSLVVSLDGFAPTHDALRRREGLFDRALCASRRVRELSPQLNMTVVTTVTRPVVGQMVDLVHWVERGPLFHAICFHTLSGNLGSEQEGDPFWYRRSELWPGEIPELYRELDQLMLMSDQGFPLVNTPGQLSAMERFYASPEEVWRPCDQHGTGMLVLPDGAVKICPLHDPIGSITTHSLVELWRSPAATDLRRAMATCRRNCHLMTNFAFQRHEIR